VSRNRKHTLNQKLHLRVESKEPYYQEHYGYYMGGSYCVELSADGTQLFFGMNGNDKGDGQAFGLPGSMLLHIPASERLDDTMGGT
jgi:hypothetical protein